MIVIVFVAHGEARQRTQFDQHLLLLIQRLQQVHELALNKKAVIQEKQGVGMCVHVCEHVCVHVCVSAHGDSRIFAMCK